MDGIYSKGDRAGFWRRPWLEQERQRLRDALSAAPGEEGKRLARRTDERSQISAFLHCIEALRADAAENSLSSTDRHYLVETAVRILARAGIGPSGSNLSSLHDDLISAIGLKLDIAALSRLGEQRATDTIAWLDANATAPPSLDRARRLRETAEYFQAEAELDRLDRARPPTFPPSPELFWEKHLHAIARDGDLGRLPKHERPPHEVYLWAYALPQRSGMARFPRRGDGVVGTLEAAYDLSIPKAVRWSWLVDTLGNEAGSLGAQELGLLIAATARWLLRHREKQAATDLLRVYGDMAQILSRGLTRDHLGLFQTEPAPQALTVVPVHWQRAGVLTTLTLEVTLLLGRLRFASLFGNETRKKRLREEEAKALTALLVRHLSGLKGPLMKAGQTASYFGWQLPGVASEALASLQAESMPLETSAVVEVIERELGRPLAAIFPSFEETPCGVGSIGQVHRATLANGDRVAVKVQFPGIEDAICTDIRLLHLVLPLLRALTASAVNRDLLAELETELLNECDYARELRLMERFRRLFTDVPRLVIPKTYDELSTRRVLVTEYVEGQTLEAFRGSAALPEKQSACESITEYVVRGCCVGIFNADPHPGNFLFRAAKGDVEVVCLDFGAVKEWPLEISVPWAELILAGTLRDYPLFLRAVESMGIITDRNNFDFKRLYDVYTGGAMGNTILDVPQHMTHQQLHDELRGYADRKLLNHTYFRPDYLYGIRVYTGLISILASLNAPINYFQQIKTICLKSLGKVEK